jgi:hypothetical protein
MYAHDITTVKINSSKLLNMFFMRQIFAHFAQVLTACSARPESPRPSALCSACGLWLHLVNSIVCASGYRNRSNWRHRQVVGIAHSAYAIKCNGLAIRRVECETCGVCRCSPNWIKWKRNTSVYPQIPLGMPYARVTGKYVVAHSQDILVYCFYHGPYQTASSNIRWW